MFDTPKTDRSRRTIPIPKVVADVLATHPATQAAERLAAESAWQDNDLLFPTTIGSPQSARNLLRWFKAQCKAARIGEDHRWYDVRP